MGGLEMLYAPLEDLSGHLEGADVREAQDLGTSCTLYKLPPEIRDKILELSLVWTGETPGMLAALRQEPGLYFRAITIFRQINIYKFVRIKWRNHVPRSTIEKIERLSIHKVDAEMHPVVIVLCQARPGGDMWRNFNSWTMTLRELRLDLGQLGVFKYVVRGSPRFANARHFPRLSKLCIRFPPAKSIISCRFSPPPTVERAVQYVNEALGVTARLEGVGARPVSDGVGGLRDADVWFWEVPEKRTFAAWAGDMRRIPREEKVHRKGQCQCYFCWKPKLAKVMVLEGCSGWVEGGGGLGSEPRAHLFNYYRGKKVSCEEKGLTSDRE